MTRITWAGAAALWAITTSSMANPTAEEASDCEQIPGHPKIADIDRAAHAGAQAAPAAARVGEVVKTMTSGGYTYALLDVNDELVWVAGPEMTVEPGEKLITSIGSQMADFHSRTLDKTFDRIWFVASMQSASTSEIAASERIGGDLPVAVEPLADGVTVEHVLSGAVELSGSEVAVRGTVVKITANVMQRNWVHIQDGTGSESNKTRDLTVTTQSEVAVGDVVTVQGVVATNRDFGAGYVYDVIIEDAVVSAP